MEKIDCAVKELYEMDELASRVSPIHSLHPLSKLIVTIAYILFTVSFDRYEPSGLFVMLLYPVIMFQISGISLGTCIRKMKYMIILVCAVGIFNPIFDTETITAIGSLEISGGTVSMLTLILKGLFSVMASFILAATTPIDSLCAGLRKIHIPRIITTLILLTYRYISVMMNEVSVMNTAYKLRAPGQKGIAFSAWGSFLGQLILRSMDRANELYDSMRLRGFSGDFIYADLKKTSISDILFVFFSCSLFTIVRLFNIAELIGKIVTGGVL